MVDPDGPAAALARLIRREGPVPFDVFMDVALYSEGGFFASGHGAGRAAADFITSPEVGPLFGALVAAALDRSWEALGALDPFVVVEVGAGRGRLAHDVVRAAPRCLSALRYVLVERSPALRAEQRALVALEPPDEALGPYVMGADAPEPVAGSGPVITSLDELPGIEFHGVVVANELLDNLPFGIAEFDGARWQEIRVGLDAGGAFVEMPVPALDPDVRMLERTTVACALAPGDRLPIPRGIARWLSQVAGALTRGDVVLIDTMDTAAGMLARGFGAWMRTYRAHERGGDPLVAPGSRDLVGDVVVEQLRHVAADCGFVVVADTDQATWLRALGLEALVDAGRREWEARAGIGDLAAMEARSRGPQAAALTDPAGLGAHRVVVLGRRRG